jgi:NAD(P)-dependent dehydrogenase (short-subunit alcohol dehydrogenase family)
MSYTEELFSLTNQVAAVIGGGGVLGGAMAEGLARAGAHVAILDLSPEKANAAAESLRQYGIRSIGIETDVSSKSSLAAAEAKIFKEMGPAQILVNAPGINSSTPFFEIATEEYSRIMDVNLKGMVLACQIFGKRMIDEKVPGSIINISSASSGPPLSKVFTYSLSKAGVNNLTQFLANDWAAHNIRVNAIAPGFFPAEQNRKILTEERIADIMRHTPMNRFGEAAELVGAVIWLASNKASAFVTGAIIRVDGGFTAKTI